MPYHAQSHSTKPIYLSPQLIGYKWLPGLDQYDFAPTNNTMDGSRKKHEDNHVSYNIECNSQTSKHEYNKCMKVQHTKSTDQQAGQGPTDPVTIVNPHKCPLLNHDGNQATNELKAWWHHGPPMAIHVELSYDHMYKHKPTKPPDILTPLIIIYTST